MKKITLLSVITAVAVVGVSLSPAIVSAQSAPASLSISGSGTVSGSATAASLEAQIAALLSQLAALRNRFGASSTMNMSSSMMMPPGGPISVPPFMPVPSSTMPWVPSSTVSCQPFNRNLSIGSQGSDVTQLQAMLSQNVNFPKADITGFFGPITARALASFQVSSGIAASSSATGFFGPLTRNFLEFHCPGMPLPVVPPGQPLPFQPGGPILPPIPPTPPGSASSTNGATISPASGKVGTSVTITGVASDELGATETVLMGGLVAARNVAVASDGSITFTVPGSLAPNCSMAPMTACPMFMALTTAHAYSISLINPSSTTPLLVGEFTVTGGIGLNPGPVILPGSVTSSAYGY